MKLHSLFIGLNLLWLVGCGQPNYSSENKAPNMAPKAIAFGSPGDKPTWAFAGKTGVGTSYERYVDGKYQTNPETGDVSRVWFSIADGVLTETMYGLIHEAQLKDLQIAMRGSDWLSYERTSTVQQVEYLHTDSAGRPMAPAYKLSNRDTNDRYRIEKHIFTDPDSNSVWHRVIVEANEDNVTPIVLINPHINNTGWDDTASVSRSGFSVEDNNTAMSVLFSRSPIQRSVGFKGTSDGYTDLLDGELNWQYTSTGDQKGNVVATASLPTLAKGQRYAVDIILGFGDSNRSAEAAATLTLNKGYQAVFESYVGIGNNVGWEDYINSLSELPNLIHQSNDNGKLAYSSALVLKVQEDKTYAGALIASLSNPWGDTVAAVEPATGYKAVWPRDFYQCAMALLAIGDHQTAKIAFEYLPKVQVMGDKHGNRGAGGWFYQKAEVSGRPEWVAVQLDQTAMPIMLGWQLWQQGHFTEAELHGWYKHLLKPAADFLADGGFVDIDWNKRNIQPPRTQQERWEEQFGYSPSTMAAIVAGLVSAADIANHLNDTPQATRYLTAADQFQASIDQYTYTTQGMFENHAEYYVRISQNKNPNDNATLDDRNGKGQLNEAEILDGGFLELVRYGVKKPTNAKISRSVAAIDDLSLPTPLRVRYEFNDDKGNPIVGWRRYGNDGYGETTQKGINYGAGGTHGGNEGGMSPDQRGRVWPFLSGERGHYEIAKGTPPAVIKQKYIAALEYFANHGLMLPEQVWDGVGHPTSRNYRVGEGTNSATPLAWAHAEYLKLLRSNRDQRVFDTYPLVIERYQSQ